MQVELSVATAYPAARASFAKSAPMPRLAPVMNQTFLLLTTFSNLPLLTAYFGDVAVPVRSAHAAIHQEVAASDEAPILAHEQRGDGTDFVRRAAMSSRASRSDTRATSPSPDRVGGRAA